MEKAFKAMGYATQVKSLADYHDDYGLEGSDDADDNDEAGEGEDEDMSEGDDDASMEDDGSADEL